MAAGPRVGVVGVAIRPRLPDDARHSLEEHLHAAMQAALADAGLSTRDLEGIVVGANDQYDGRAISVMMASAPLGGVDRDILSTPSSGEHAFVLGALRIASGQFRTQLVAAWSPTEASSIPEAQRLANDPLFHRRLPLDELAAAALQANALEHAAPGTAALAERLARTWRANGARAFPGAVEADLPAGRVTRWPLRTDMVRAPDAGLVVLMLASEEFIRERGLGPVAWISGMGWATEPAFLGDRDLAKAPALEAAARQAYGEAGIAAATDAFDLAEVTDATPYQALLAMEALGLAPRRDWQGGLAAFGPDGRLPVNLSGGVASMNPVFCTGLIRIAEVANQLRGRAGAHQKQGARRGLAHAASGPAMQYQTVIVLEAGEGRTAA
ncbi:thiolase C-terminal domain-containing protein [Falsiroseomonas sp. CW058]|uniref:thiolase C-terminal domain-containing protein n=1 Tax=Falsiroseomonas sp. CW058 TaxID=3388664 RepID=UPI003D31B41D